MDKPPVEHQDSTAAATTLAMVLVSLAIFVASVGLLVAAFVLLDAVGAQSITPVVVLSAILYALGGLSVGALLAALAWIVRKFDELVGLHRRGRGQAAAAEFPPAHGAASSAELSQILAELKDIGRLMLLSPRQRHVKRVQEHKSLADELAATASAAIDARQFDVAQQHISRLAQEVPDDARAVELSRRLVEARHRSMEQDMEQATQRATDLMAISSFAEAQQLVEGLLARYPSHPKIQALAEHVRRETATFTTEQRRRLYKDIEHHAENRRWRQAVTAAKKFLQAYPAGAEADLVRVQMPTMETNAAFEEVRDLRDRILDYIERRRYLEAIELSRDVLARFPKTAAAEELREQLPRLLELARSSPSPGGRS